MESITKCVFQLIALLLVICGSASAQGVKHISPPPAYQHNPLLRYRFHHVGVSPSENDIRVATRTRPGEKFLSSSGPYYSPDEKHIVVSSLWGLHIWDIQTRRFKFIAIRGIGSNPQVCFSADGKKLALGGWANKKQGGVLVFSVRTGRKIVTLNTSVPTSSLAFSGDGKLIAAGSEGGVMTIWNVPSGHVIHSYKGLIAQINAVNFFPDNKRVLFEENNIPIVYNDPKNSDSGLRWLAVS